MGPKLKKIIKILFKNIINAKMLPSSLVRRILIF